MLTGAIPVSSTKAPRGSEMGTLPSEVNLVSTEIIKRKAANLDEGAAHIEVSVGLRTVGRQRS